MYLGTTLTFNRITKMGGLLECNYVTVRVLVLEVKVSVEFLPHPLLE